MSNFSQMMNDRSEARRIYNQRRKISQLELKNKKLEQEIKQFREMWKDTNIIIRDDKKLILNGNAYDCLQEKDKEIERLNNIINMAISAINTYQDSKTLSIGYENLKRIRGILRGNGYK